ncbi:replication restart helicase PriA [Desulfogranum japonicum]|uniref:replication restart helicase PriA n=1 Tax=Desulfogranum japonicum TaxID=231447 RepID=UPI0004040C91|nr:primosomal protein N' [Desulfogranum japonicum]
MIFYEVAVNAPIANTLTYKYSGPAIDIGHAVLVPLGRRKVTGYVLDRIEEDEQQDKGFVVKAVERVLSGDPVFPRELIPLYRWLSSYYHYPIGEVLFTALPAAPSAKSGIYAKLIPGCEEKLSTFAGVEETFPEVVLQLQQTRHLSHGMITRLRKSSNGRKLLSQLEKEQIIQFETEIITSRTQEKYQVVYGPSDSIAGLLSTDSSNEHGALQKWVEQTGLSLKPSELKTLGIVSELYRSLGTWVPKSAVQKQYKQSGRYLKSLVENNLLVQEESRVYRNPFGEPVDRKNTCTQQHTEEQRRVLEKILPAIAQGEFAPFLLHGVTGSGKTEIYLQAVQEALKAGKSALVLVPEIALATQMEEQFYTTFGDQLSLLHSGLTAGERLDQWHHLRQGSARVALGARSAVFAPLSDVGIIVVDEEHESAYKQDDGLRYHGRDVAVMRAKMAGCPVILGSATPSINSYANTTSGKYTLLSMEKRVSSRALPEVQIVDLSKGKRNRPDLFFSDQLIEAMNTTLERREQILLFVNRRGYSSSMICQDCGSIVQCRHCQVSMTRHRAKQKLLCHYCGFTLPVNILCQSCHSERVIGIGLGSERIEQEAEQLFPHARIARLDSDIASHRKKYLETLSAVRQGQIDILVGTQMIAKGLHFPGITLVGVIWADSGLAMPDYKASERVFSLLSQVTGRAGRGDKPGSVIIQTHQPHHYAVTCAQAHDYTGLVDKELPIRSLLNFPPFGRLVNIKFSGENEKLVEKAARKVNVFFMKHFTGGQIEQLGPAPSPLAKVKDQYRWQLLLKSSDYRILHAMVDSLQEHQSSLKLGNVKLSIDIDPENMM